MKKKKKRLIKTHFDFFFLIVLGVGDLAPSLAGGLELVGGGTGEVGDASGPLDVDVEFEPTLPPKSSFKPDLGSASRFTDLVVVTVLRPVLPFQAVSKGSSSSSSG